MQPTTAFPKIFSSHFIPTISPAVLWFVFLSAVVIFLAISLALEYHWMRYGRKSPRIILAELIFFFVAIVLFAFALMAVESF